MPPKKRTCPIVVGTVSTRSTRRESVVNIEIVPKSKKSTKKTKKMHDQQEIETSPVIKSKSENKEILEILRDWSDDDSSQEDKVVESQNLTCEILSISDESTSQDTSAMDKQSLIDILEGKHLTPMKSSDADISIDCSVENPIIEVESPATEDPEIIEECVVEDSSVIIEISDEHEMNTHHEPELEVKPVDEDISNQPIEVISDDKTEFIECIVENDSMNHNKPVEDVTDPLNMECEYISDNVEVVEETVVECSEELSEHSDFLSSENIIEREVSSSSEDTLQSMETVGDEENSIENVSVNITDKVEESLQLIHSEVKNIETVELADKDEILERTTSQNDKIIPAKHESENETGITTTEIEINKLNTDMKLQLSISDGDKNKKTSEGIDEVTCSKVLSDEKDKETQEVFYDEVVSIEKDDLPAHCTKEKVLLPSVESEKNQLLGSDQIEMGIENLNICGENESVGTCDEAKNQGISTEESIIRGSVPQESQLVHVDNEKFKTIIEAEPTKNIDPSPINKRQMKSATKEKNKKSNNDTNKNKTMDKRPRKSSRKKDAITEAANKTSNIKDVKSTGKSRQAFKSKTAKSQKETKKKLENSDISDEVRRSNRIKSISSLKRRSTHGLVRSKSDPTLSEGDFSDTNSLNSVEMEKAIPTPPPKPKDKSRTKSKAKENVPLNTFATSKVSPQTADNQPLQLETKPEQQQATSTKDSEIETRLKSFIHLKENLYKTDRQICKEAKEMLCDCYLAEEDIQNNEYGCGDDCLNKLLLIECGVQCQVKERCTNKRFQKGHFAPVEVFKTDKKGLGLRAAANIPYGEFILEYVGEVLDPDEFDKRAEVYSEDKNIHHYFMSLRADAIIDATAKGNISRFINHSCDPNAETQKWTVNGELRIGFFSTRTILAGEEITFDYRFQRYGREAQKCYCEAATCRGWLGERPDESEDEDEEEEEELEKETASIEKTIEDVAKGLDISDKTPETDEVKTTAEKTDLEVASTDLETQKKSTIEAPKPVTAPVKTVKRKPRKEILEELDQFNEDIELLVTTGLKNQAHTLKLSRLMVRAKEPEQRKKLLHVLRRGELPCRRLFLDYHGLRLMHGYMIDAEQLAAENKQFESAKLELLQTLAVLPIQNKTMLIETKVLPAVEKMAGIKQSSENEKDEMKAEQQNKASLSEKEEEIRFLAKKLLEEWVNLKESFRIPKKQRIEQMKEHEKEANRKFMASSYAQEQDSSSRKSDQRYRTWSRYKSERESSTKKGCRNEDKEKDKDKPSAAFLKISKHERRKLFALQMELKEEERRLKQREMWRQHEMNCMIIGTDPRFTAPFDPSRGFQYIWNPTIGQWQAFPATSLQSQSVFNSTTNQSTNVPVLNVQPQHRPSILGTYPSPIINNLPSLPSTPTQIPSLNIPTMTVPLPAEPTQPPLPTTPIFSEVKKDEDQPVRFAGPIPPPVKLPPKWKCAKDKYGRPYYYHIKIRKSQWEPPPLPEKILESSESSSSETSTLSSDTSSESDTDSEMDDTKLLMEVRKQMEKAPKLTPKVIAQVVQIKQEEKEEITPSPEIKEESEEEDFGLQEGIETPEIKEEPSSIDIRLKEQFNLEDDKPPQKKRRVGLCQEILISPRTEEDRLQAKEDLKRYKANKEKLKRHKDLASEPRKKKSPLGDDTKKHKDKKSRSSVKTRIKEISSGSNDAKKIKENFRSNMATTVVSVLNAYRKPDCKEGRITNTEDFKHLARKLTHFVMLKEMKHIDKIDELTCTDNVKAKAREYIKKYMSKFGENYQKRQDEPDFKD